MATERNILEVLVKEKGAAAVAAQVDRIAKGLGIANATQDKFEKGSSQMGKNSTANFAKMSQGLGGLVHVYATVAANVFALSSAFLLLSKTADVSIMISAADQLSTSTGISYANVAASMKEVTQGALSMEEALRSASIGISSGLSGEQMEEIAEIATKAANALGRSVPEAINRMTQAVVKNEPELVDEYGIILRVDAAMKEYAATLGKTKTELTSFDKQMAIHAQLVKQGSTKFGDVEGQVNTYSKLAASFKEMSFEVLGFMNKALSPLADLFAENGMLLAGIAAIFAKSIFNKAVPEVQNMVENLKAQRAEYAGLIDDKQVLIKQQKQLDAAMSVSNRIKTKPQRTEALGKNLRSMVAAGGFDELSDSVRHKIEAGVQRGTADGFKMAANNIPRDFTKKIEDLQKTALTSKDTEQVLKARLALEKQGITNASEYLFLQKDITLEGRKQTLEQKNTETWWKKNINSAELYRLQLEKHKLLVKDARASAFGAGATGGLTGGGLANARQTIADNLAGSLTGSEKKFSFIQRSGIKIAGIFGNISGILGGMLSMFSTFGLVAFAVSTAIVPIADALGLSSKSAREAQSSFYKATEDLVKLKETADEIDGKNFEDMQGFIDKLSASANNFNEQLGSINKQFEKLGEVANMTMLDKLFSLKPAVEFSEQIAEVTTNLEEMYAKEGIEIPTDLLDNSVKITAEAKKLIGYQKQLSEINKKIIKREGSLKANRNDRAKMLDFIATVQDRYNKLLHKMTEPLKEVNQLQRDRLDLANRALTAAEELAKAETKAKTDFAKKSPYYEKIKNLEVINQLLQEEAGNTKVIAAEAEKYAEATNTSILSNEKFTKLMDAQLERALTMNTIALESKVQEIQKQNELKLINDRINDGDTTAMSEKIKTNEELTAIKISQLVLQKAELDATVAANDTLKQREERELAILNIEAAIAGLVIDSTLARKKSNEELESMQQKINQSMLSQVKNTQTVLGIESNIAKIKAKSGNAGSIGNAFEAEKAVLIGKQAENIAEISRLRKEEGDKSNKLKDTQGEINVLLAKNREISAKMTEDYSEQDKLVKQLAATQKKFQIEALKYNQDALKAKMELQSVESEASASTTTVGREFEILTKSMEIKERIFNFELKSAKEKEASARATLAALDVETKDLVEIEKIEKARLTLINSENSALELRLKYEEESYANAMELFELQKRKANIFNDPTEFIGLLGKEFDLLANDFSKAIMDPVSRAADSILRLTDTTIDTLYDAISTGEDVGQAVGDAVQQVLADISKEYFTETVKGLARNILGEMFPKTEEEKQTSLLEQIAQNTKCETIGNVNDIDLTEMAGQTVGLDTELISEITSGNVELGILSENSKVGFAGMTKMLDSSTTDQTMELVDNNNGLFGNLTSMLSNIFSSMSSAGGDTGGSLLSSLGSFITSSAGNAITASTLGTTIGSQQTSMLTDQWNPLQLAKGGIVTAPTSFANGQAEMGEDGPEGVLPLTKVGGVLGVSTAGGGDVKVNVNNYANATVTTNSNTDAKGNKSIDIMIEEKLNEAIQNGAVDNRMGSVYGVRRRGY